MTTLLLSGWGQPADALAPLADDAVFFDYSDYPTPDAAIHALKKLTPTDVVGWSMGGQLAVRAIAAGAIAPRHLTLIAAPFQFVTSSASVVKGMDPLTFAHFRANYAADPARTKERFHGLIAKGDGDARRIMAQLRHHPQVEDTARWLPWLDALADFSLATLPLANLPPTLIIHGMNDAIVPYAQGEHLARVLPQAVLSGWERTGHAPHLHDAARVREQIARHRTSHGMT